MGWPAVVASPTSTFRPAATGSPSAAGTLVSVLVDNGAQSFTTSWRHLVFAADSLTLRGNFAADRITFSADEQAVFALGDRTEVGDIANGGVLSTEGRGTMRSVPTVASSRRSRPGGRWTCGGSTTSARSIEVSSSEDVTTVAFGGQGRLVGVGEAVTA